MEQALLTVFAARRANANAGPSAKTQSRFDEREASMATSTALDAKLDMSRAVLDHVHFGVTVVGQEFELLFANAAASRECSRHPILRIDRDRLVLVEARYRVELQRAIAATQTGRWSLVRVGEGDHRMMLAVLPLGVCQPKAPALVVFGLRSNCKSLAIEFYAQASKLSPAETGVLRGLNDGQTPREIARNHKVALSTVRSQIGSIREKTGARSIMDLVRTLGCLPPVMPAAVCTL